MARVRLHSLSLAGFKSFPDKVDLTFPGDISAIAAWLASLTVENAKPLPPGSLKLPMECGGT